MLSKTMFTCALGVAIIGWVNCCNYKAEGNNDEPSDEPYDCPLDPGLPADTLKLYQPLVDNAIAEMDSQKEDNRANKTIVAILTKTKKDVCGALQNAKTSSEFAKVSLDPYRETLDKKIPRLFSPDLGKLTMYLLYYKPT